MKLITKTLIPTLTLCFNIAVSAQNKNTTDTYKPNIALATEDNRYASKDWYNWGGSIVKGEDDRYYLFHSRFPKSIGFYSWLTHSEIAVASSDTPSGPWKHEYTALQGRGGDHWDSVTAHNPKIKKYGDTYYLYYIGTHGKFTPEQLVATAQRKNGPKLNWKANWSTLRNNMRTGVATSKSIRGPWKRADAPCIVPEGPVKKITVNPAVTPRPDGGYLMMIKGDKFDKPASPRVQAIALADTPEGPFKIQPKPAISDFDTEDASIWWDAQRKRYYAIFHAHTYFGMITSEDGLNWKKAANYKFAGKGFKTTDGKTFKGRRMERPAIYLGKDGQPAVFISSYLQEPLTAILTLPLKK